MMILPHPTVELEEVDELTISDRGEGGYGSTGN
jgi:dUTPase